MSMVPSNVTKSAKKCPLANTGKTCKWWKAGDLTLHLYGWLVPSDIKETPNSPFGDSTAL